MASLADMAILSGAENQFSSPDTGLVVSVFQKGDDPIDAINHMMSFLTSFVTSRYPAINNQLRTSSNPRQQATINDERVTIQPIQGRQNHMSAGLSRPFTSGSGGTSGRQRTVMNSTLQRLLSWQTCLITVQIIWQRAFTTYALVPTIYVQRLWNTLTYEAKTDANSFQLDETRFILDANLLRDALEITPINQAHQFVSPPLGDAIMDFVNQLGYIKVIHFVSRWR
nr:hypothetical protein [Tanacetum cinerariifolium]